MIFAIQKYNKKVIKVLIFYEAMIIEIKSKPKNSLT
jgi:hypothetical protein